MSDQRSAFVQQRDKISHTIFEDILENFNALHQDMKMYKGYRVLAVDGTCVNMARNPQSASFMQHTGNPKGYNQLHVNPLYDVLNKTYVHCHIQPQQDKRIIKRREPLQRFPSFLCVSVAQTCSQTLKTIADNINWC